VGMLVDNSIVVLENTFRHRELGKDSIESATRGAEEVQGAITASTLTTIAVFGPIIYIEGVAGELFGALSLAVAFSLLASIFVALTLLPTLAARVGRAAGREKGEEGRVKGEVRAPTRASVETSEPADGESAEGPRSAGEARGLTDGWRILAPLRRFGDAFDRGFAHFARWYEDLLLRALERRRAVLAVSLGLLLMTVVVGWNLDRRFLPVVDQGEFSARIELPRGTPLERTEEAARQVESVFLADDAVAAVFTSVGYREAITGLERDETGLHTAQVDVRLEEGESTDAILERVRSGLSFLPEGSLAIESGEATAIGKLLGGGEAELAVRVRGEDTDASLAYAAVLESRLAQLPTLENVRMGTRLGQPEMRIEIDRERAASYGISPVAIASAIEGYMYGTAATEFVDFDRKIPVVVRLPDQDRRSLEMLQSLRVSGVPLGDLVHVQSTLGPTEIRREGQARLMPVYADVRSGGLEEAIAEIEAVLRSEPPPAGLRVEVGGENEEMERSFRELAFAFGLALLLVFMILAAEFENFLHPFVILLSVPMGLVGAVLALWVTGSGFNTMSLIGIVVLAGIVDNDAVVKVDFINQMRRDGLPLRQAILAAGHARLRPILMTTLTTLLGLLPMAVAAGRGAELRAPLAIAVFGGLFSATALTLIVLPVLYEALEDGKGLALAWVRGEGSEAADGADGRAKPLVPAPGD
jgi:HAE1 family hydrophobic/amphiphilic exporter-1